MRIIGGRLGGRQIKVVESAGLRPATGRVREALFSMLEARGMVFAGIRVLDLFAGSGGVGIEALSRGAEQAVFVERAPAVVKVLRENLASLGLGPDRARVVSGDVAKVLPKLAGQAFDLAAIDPPYGQGLAGPAIERLMALGLLAPDAMVVAEVEAGLDLSAQAPAGLECLADRTYGQTRIIVWAQQTLAWRSIPEPSIP
jgi:16S rRNA (guanine966-N2)-methyltransferase